jgi:CheY-like chemotaxis protein
MNTRILVIEDNLVNLELVTDLLESKGFSVMQAHTAEEGLRRAREHQPELILMDLSLPGMDGLAATKLLKADPATAHLRIVALTAHAMRGDDAVAKAAGCDGYLTKPIDTRRFPEQISTFLVNRSAGDRAAQNTPPGLGQPQKAATVQSPAETQLDT